MYKVIMVVDGNEYVYGQWNDANKANEIAMEVREQRRIDVFVERSER